MLLPFRSQPASTRLPDGYGLLVQPEPQVDSLNQLLRECGERPRSPMVWTRVIQMSAWHLVVQDPQGRWVGFIRATSDRALNANLWDLLSLASDPAREQVIKGLVDAGLERLRRELSGCSISISAPVEAITALRQAGFAIDPGGIRAMGLSLGEDAARSSDRPLA
ncbi:MAG: N-acetyltransferase [Cyanobacteriota bacterium]|nr:N-acetyltransferase [Cyanobacteriota bacterium]